MSDSQFTKIWAWGAFLFGAVFFALPLIGMTEFSLRIAPW